jgi:hypothetical protein
LLAVMAKAHVWPNSRAKLADELVREDGAGWVRQALGWLCYGVKRFGHWDIGAVVYPALRDRLLVEPAHLPPEGLGFAAALAWAEAGGEAGPRYANEEESGQAAAGSGQHGRETDGCAGRHSTGAEGGRRTDEGRRPEADSGSDSGSEGDDGQGGVEARVWARAQARLQAELPGAAVGLWLRGARVSALGEGRWRLTVPTPQARDWLNNRLRERLERALGEGARLEIRAVGEC